MTWTRHMRLVLRLLAASVVYLTSADVIAESRPHTATRVVEYAGTPVRVRLSVGEFHASGVARRCCRYGDDDRADAGDPLL